MPWKTTKLAFFGIAVRRRTLYALTLVCTIAAVPVLSLALLFFGGNFARGQKIGFISATIITLALALNGWRLILKHNIALFREEARVIWPGAVVLLFAATGIACAVADSVVKRGRMDYIVPLVFGGGMFIVFVVRCARLGHYPKRSEIVRGSSGRRHSRSGLPATPQPQEAVVVEPVAEDDAGPESPLDKSVS
jgi:hypothetical protein